MSDIAATKKLMGQALKKQFETLKVPSEASKKISAPKMRLEAQLKSGAHVVVGCADVKRGRPPGHFGLYWMYSLAGGLIQEIRESTRLDQDPHAARPYIVTSTSHNHLNDSHYEIRPNVNFDAVVRQICDDIREHAFPIIEAFESKPARALDVILNDPPGAISLPFTTAIILMHLAGQTHRLSEITQVASTRQGFYDFKSEDEARVRIMEPLAQYFASRPPRPEV